MTEHLKKRPEYEQLAQTIFIQLIRPDNKNLVVDAIKEHLTEGMMIIIFTLMVLWTGVRSVDKSVVNEMAAKIQLTAEQEACRNYQLSMQSSLRVAASQCDKLAQSQFINIFLTSNCSFARARFPAASEQQAAWDKINAAGFWNTSAVLTHVPCQHALICHFL